MKSTEGWVVEEGKGGRWKAQSEGSVNKRDEEKFKEKEADEWERKILEKRLRDNG